MMLLKWLFGMLRALISGRKPAEVAGGFACGLLLALIPGGNILWVTLFLVSFLLNINVGAAMLSLGIFRILVPLADPLLDRLGYGLLSLPELRPFFTRLLDLPLVGFARLNNSLVCGGLVAGLLLLIPSFLAFKILVVLFREKVVARIAASRMGRWFMRLPLAGKLGLLLRRLARFYPEGS
jgi:uncharacterized protein (TIGR03546 family)